MVWQNGVNYTSDKIAIREVPGMSLEQAQEIKAPDAPITFTVWYDYI